MKVVQLKNVWEMFRIKFIEEGKAVWENYWALKDISLDVKKGETLGLIGENGSGKSTILKLIAGMLKPDRGEVIAKGRVSGLLELGAGFELDMTGRENIYNLASLYGLTKEQINNKFQAIADFADIGRFINAPVKSYSSGMFVRLAFALAIHVEPEILLIDDVLAVGDEFFQRKCIKRIFELKEQGKTIIFVTHDMNMLRRLCLRTVFLKDGRIVKDGLVDEIIPLYSQMVGSRSGVGILEKEPLRAVFNNGKLFMNWHDKPLAINSGMYTAFRIDDKWYNSIQADWEVNKEDEKTLVAKGTLHQLGLVQIWRLELDKEYEINLDIEIESEEGLEIQEGYTNIMLTNEYQQWFTVLEKGDFPSIGEHDQQWQALLNIDSVRRCAGVKTEPLIDKNLAPLVLELSKSSRGGYLQVLNTDYFTNCRVLQYRQVGLQNYSGEHSNRFSYFSGKIVVGVSDINSYLNTLEREISLDSGDLKLQFDKGQVIILWKGIKLTKSKNINTSIYANNKRFFSSTAAWELKRENENKLVARGTWPNLALTQVWEIEIIDSTSFLLKVDMEISEDIEVPEQYLQFECSENYQYYCSGYAEGEFPKIIDYCVDIMQRCIPDGLVGLKSKDSKFPSVFVKFSEKFNNFAKFFNSDISSRARLLSIEKTEAEGETKFKKGNYKCFELEVNLKEENIVGRKTTTKTFEKEGLQLIFDKGRGRIFYKERELTKRLGVYTSLRSDNRWNDSFSGATWDIEETKKGGKFLGKWLYLPIIQYWQFNLDKKNTIDFYIHMVVDKKITLERQQINIMLSERYEEWFTKEDKGTFPLFKPDVDDDWDVIWSKSKIIEKEFIAAAEDSKKNKDLPKVKLVLKQINSDWQLNIVNSDIYHRGRILQYLKNKKEDLLPGEYLYYKGSIEIEDI